MNLILFEPEEIDQPLPKHDPRAVHILSILKSGEGDSLRAGVVNGRKGRLTILSAEGESLRFDFAPEDEPESLYPVELVIGAPRPLVTKRLLKDLSSLGLGKLLFTRTDLSEKSYLESGLWKNGEYRRHLYEGAEQAVSTRIPEVRLFPRLEACLEALQPATRRFVLDPTRGRLRIQDVPLDARHVALAIGPERGWTNGELDTFSRFGFEYLRLGDRILRTEAACLAASSILLSRLGYM